MDEPGKHHAKWNKPVIEGQILHDSSSSHKTGKGQFSFQFQRKGMPKNVQATTQLYSFNILARSCSKSFELAFSTMWIEMYKLDLEKAEEPEINFPTTIGSQRKQGSSRKKKSTPVSLTVLKPLTVWITESCEKF